MSGLFADAVAVPSVKRLGGANTYTGAGAAASAKSGTIKSSGLRSSSVRTNRVTGTKGTSSVKTTSNPSAVANTSRLSVGKYLHTAGTNAGIIKPVSGSSITPSEISDLTVRIENLENTYITKSEIQNNYYTKSDVDNSYVKQDDADNSYVTKTEIQNYYTSAQVDEKLDNLTPGIGQDVVDTWETPDWW